MPRCGADDGNRTRVFSLGRRFYSRRATVAAGRNRAEPARIGAVARLALVQLSPNRGYSRGSETTRGKVTSSVAPRRYCLQPDGKEPVGECEL